MTPLTFEEEVHPQCGENEYDDNEEEEMKEVDEEDDEEQNEHEATARADDTTPAPAATTTTSNTPAATITHQATNMTTNPNITISFPPLPPPSLPFSWPILPRPTGGKSVAMRSSSMAFLRSRSVDDYECDYDEAMAEEQKMLKHMIKVIDEVFEILDS